MKSFLVLLLMLAVLALVGYAGWVARDFEAGYSHPPMCETPASTRALQGCEATAHDLGEEIEETRYDLRRCEYRVEHLTKTMNCMMDPNSLDCRGPQ